MQQLFIESLAPEIKNNMNATILRDRAWARTDRIPTWVKDREIGLDQYNTLPEVAKYCLDSFQKFLKKQSHFPIF